MANLLMDRGADPKGAQEFISRLLQGAVTAHLHHLATDSYARHMALGDLYEGLPGLVDALAEAWLGCTGQKLAAPGDPVAEVQSLYEYVEAARGKMGTESHIQNEVDNVANLLAATLYKLRQLS